MEKKITKIISYELKFIDNSRFMAISISNLANNIVEGINKIRCKYKHDNKKC